jgi:hypothetical protein
MHVAGGVLGACPQKYSGLAMAGAGFSRAAAIREWLPIKLSFFQFQTFETVPTKMPHIP